MLRDHFPIFKTKTFINSCSKGALSTEVRTAYERYLYDWQHLGSPWGLWVENLEKLRASFAKLINAEPDEIAVTTSVSAAVSSLASALSFDGKRKKVVVSDFEFPTVAQNWHAQATRGACIEHVAEQGGEISLERLEAAIDEQTKLVAIAHVCYRNGALQDAKRIAEMAHKKGALLLLDAYQSLGTLALDVKALDVDILVGGTLKYLLGSSGLAFMYVRKELLSELNPTATGWFAQEDIMALDIYQHQPSHSARRFESGTPPNPNIYAGLAGLELIHQLGIPAINTHLLSLTTLLKEAALQNGYALATPKLHGAMLAFKSHEVEKLVDLLAEDDIIVSSRDGNLRISPHFYNSEEDIGRFLEALTRHESLMVKR
jgi:selenocysteine lyase/cysteine desulfurase